MFENAVALNLLEGSSTHAKIGTWKKGNNTDIEVDFILDLPEYNVKIPVECKAATRLYKRHYKNIIHYLSETNQKFGILVSAAPFASEKIKNKTVVNLPVYLAGKKNMINYFLKFCGLSSVN